MGKNSTGTTKNLVASPLGRFVLIDNGELESSFNFDRETAKRKRLSGDWQEGIHWFRSGNGKNSKVLYNRELILDWLVNRNRPELHRKAIAKFLTELPSGRA